MNLKNVTLPKTARTLAKPLRTRVRAGEDDGAVTPENSLAGCLDGTNSCMGYFYNYGVE